MIIPTFNPVQTGNNNIAAVQSQIQAGVPQIGTLDTGGIAFSELLGAYMNIVGDAGRMEQHAQHLAVEFVLGNHDDMLSVIMAQEAAWTSMSFAVQVTSRIIEAYREIMRMQI
ncbi:MAG: flagellar hook-basal body complex protein FliE [Defluviitaleaceae bacterium]|nr:flagellar hook-basal body complex protein FliE [Defluviitaleaceae bacterium]